MIAKAKEAIASALRAAGTDVATCVPGLGATEIYDDYCKLQAQRPVFSFHEEVAYTIAHGAALAGKRAFTAMKAHGFFKAANSVSDSLYSGTSAGFVSIVVDDRSGIQSDSIADTIGFVKGLGIPHKAADVHDVFNDILQGFALSEKLELPFALIIDAGDLDLPSNIPDSPVMENIDPKPADYQRNIARHVLCPPFCKYQRDVLHCKLSGGNWKCIPRPTIRPLFEALPEKWKSVAEGYSIVFEALRSVKGKITTGDTGLSTLFALPPFDCIDVTTYMGGQPSAGLGRKPGRRQARLGGLRRLFLHRRRTPGTPGGCAAAYSAQGPAAMQRNGQDHRRPEDPGRAAGAPPLRLRGACHLYSQSSEPNRCKIGHQKGRAVPRTEHHSCRLPQFRLKNIG